MNFWVRLLGICGGLLAAGLSEAPAADQPHIVLIVADDLGYADVSFNGGKVPTPNVDRIAAEGVKLDRFYVCPMCSPTRAALLTGRYPIRFGMQHAVVPPWRAFGIDPAETTLPEMLATAGYKNRGCFGKWHLGQLDKKWHPLNNGFTEFVGHYNGAIDFFTHEREGEVDWHHGLVPSDEEGYSTDLIAQHAADFITRHADDGPLFCYVPFNAVHTPLQAKPRDIKSVHPDVPGPKRATGAQIYDGMTVGMDRGVGQILKAIDDAGVADNTFVFFCSDNGGTAKNGNNKPFRGHKLTLYEGGIRVAACCRWPAGKIGGGGAVKTAMAHIDLLPICVELSGAKFEGKPLDGKNMLSALQGKAEESEPREIYSFLAQNPNDGEQLGLIEGKWKTILRGKGFERGRQDTVNEQDTVSEVELYDLEADPAEKNNLAQQNSEIMNRMVEKLIEFRQLQPQEHAGYYSGAPEGFTPPSHWDIREASPEKSNAILSVQEIPAKKRKRMPKQ